MVFDLLLERFLKPLDGGLVSKFAVHERATAAAMKNFVDVEARHRRERQTAVNDRIVNDARVRQ